MKKTIYWLIQSNQLTPTIIDFFAILKARLTEQLDLKFILPDTSANIDQKISGLDPLIFKAVLRTASDSIQVYQLKRGALNGAAYSDGLKIEDTLILDDFGGGNTRQTLLEIPFEKNVAGLVLQIPTPLGSSDEEERIFQAAIFWAAQNKIPTAGYELLPLDTRWMLAASMPDGIIARSTASFQQLKSHLSHNNIWMMPGYEASIFTPLSTHFHLNGVKSAYHFRNLNQIPTDRSILYIPHNVAMNYEYRQLLKHLIPLGDQLHLMIGVSKDQVRGAHSHQEAIEIVCRSELEKFKSYAFHNLNCPWEMMAADAVIACSACFNTLVAQKEVPCIVFDPRLPPCSEGHYTSVNTPEDLLTLINQKMTRHQIQREISDILIMLANRREN